MSSSNRIIDVNLNRLTEAMKVVEDLCRFELNDARLTGQVRFWRLQAGRVVIPLRRKVLPYRGSQQDAGRNAGFDRTPRRDTGEVLHANLKRTQEAARTLEELAKVAYPNLSPAFKAIRFRGYDLEQSILGALDRHSWAKRNFPLLYVVMDTATIGHRDLNRIARELVEGGADAIQLREPKDLPTRDFVRDARAIGAAIADSRVRFIINDRVDVALALDAGVHIGQSDMPLAAARKLLPANRIIGVSVNSAAQARRAEQQGADYLGAGAIFPTPSKHDAGTIGIPGLRAIHKAAKLPVIAIGGINAGNAGEVIRAGADGIAVISAAFQDGTIRKNLTRLRSALTPSR